MANFAEISLTSTNLTGVTDFFTVQLKECSSGSYTTVQTGLTYSDFPYLVNLDDLFGSITCYNYIVTESRTQLSCNGTSYIGSTTPTPTISVTSTPTVTPTSTPAFSVTVTPTTTPSTTPSSGVTTTPTPTVTTTPSTTPASGVTTTPTPTVTTTPSTTPTVTTTPTPSPTPESIDFGASYSSGSTIVDYSFTASTLQSQDNTISFQNVIYKTDGTKIKISTGVTFNTISRIASTRVTLPTLDYNDLKSYDTSFSAITNTLNKDYTYNKYSDIKYPDKPTKPLVNYIFRNCCKDYKPQYIYIQVPYEETLTGGWVNLGYGIVYKRYCYVPYTQGGDGSLGPIYGFDIKQCKTPECPSCPSATPTPTLSLTPSSTPRPGETLTPTPTISHTPTTTPTISITPQVTPTPSPSECDGIDCVVEVTPNPSVTPTQTVQTNLSCDVIVTPDVTPTPTQTVQTNLSCDVQVTPNVSPTPTQTIITDLDCEITVN